MRRGRSARCRWWAVRSHTYPDQWVVLYQPLVPAFHDLHDIAGPFSTYWVANEVSRLRMAQLEALR